MTISIDDARDQGEVLAKAALESPLRQYRYELRRRSKEWTSAARTFDGLEGDDADEAVIEHAGAVVAGMYALSASTWRIVVRTIARDGQFSLQLEDEVGRPVYMNFVTPASPCVVKR